MSREIKREDFLKKIKNSNIDTGRSSFFGMKKFLSAVAAISVLTLSGCATTNSNYGEFANKVDGVNGMKIIGQEKSGVYQNPFDNKEIVTLSFVGDEDSEKNIRDDLDSLGVSQFSYTWYKGVHSLGAAIGTHHENEPIHMQDPLGIVDKLNYIVLNNNSSVVLNHNQSKYRNYLNYATMMHEIAHGFDKQEMGVLDLMTAKIDPAHRIYMENSADVVGVIKTMQLMDHGGLGEKRINEFLDLYRDSRKMQSVDKPEDVYHNTFLSISFVQEMYNENPDFLLNMKNKDMEKFSDIVADVVVNADVKEEVLNEMKKKYDLDLTGMINQSKRILQESPDLFSLILKKMEKKVKNSESEMERELVSKMIDKIKEKNEIMYKSPSEIVDGVINEVINDNYGDGGIKINNGKGQDIIRLSGLLNSKKINNDIKKSLSENEFKNQFVNKVDGGLKWKIK